LLHVKNSPHVYSRDIIIKNWIINPTGKPNSGVELDLTQEHLNFWHKACCLLDRKSLVDNDSPTESVSSRWDAHLWEWLTMVSPSINVLHRLSAHMIDELGADQGVKHTVPSLEKDISALMKSLADLEVYTEKEGRTLDANEKPAQDVVSVGLALLAHGPALAKFNAEFDRIRERRRLKPVSDLLATLDQPVSPTSPSNTPIAPIASEASLQLPPIASNPSLLHIAPFNSMVMDQLPEFQGDTPIEGYE